MTKLASSGERERKAAARVKAAVEEMFLKGQLNYESLAVKLRILPLGAENMMRKTWPLAHAFRVAEALGLEPDLILGRLPVESSPSSSVPEGGTGLVPDS